jgi:hypothetical protein
MAMGIGGVGAAGGRRPRRRLHHAPRHGDRPAGPTLSGRSPRRPWRRPT